MLHHPLITRFTLLFFCRCVLDSLLQKLLAHDCCTHCTRLLVSVAGAYDAWVIWISCHFLPRIRSRRTFNIIFLEFGCDGSNHRGVKFTLEQYDFN